MLADRTAVENYERQKVRSCEREIERLNVVVTCEVHCYLDQLTTVCGPNVCLVESTAIHSMRTPVKMLV